MSNFFKSLFKNNSSDEKSKQSDNSQKNFEILKYDGIRAAKIGRADYAIACFNEALNLKKDYETLSYLSQIYIQTNELDEAKATLKQMLELQPDTIGPLLTMANLCYMQEDYKGMKEAAQQAISLEAENAIAYYLLGRAALSEKDMLMSVAHLTKSIVLKENFIEARLLRAEALLKMGQLKEADEDLEAIISQDSEDESAWLLKGQIKEAEQDWKEAEAIYSSIIDANPFNEQAYISLGKVLIEQNKAQDAVKLFNDAIELNPNLANLYHERGRAKLILGDKEGSFEDMKKGFELNPKAEETVNGQFNNQQQESAAPGIL